MTEATLNKAQQAQAIFAEEVAKGDDKLRARVIKRFKEELGMKDAGSSTYFQNCKTRAAGNKVKNYYKPASERKGQQDPSTDKEPESFEVNLKDGTIKCFLNQTEHDDWVKDNSDLIAEQGTIEA